MAWTTIGEQKVKIKRNFSAGAHKNHHSLALTSLLGADNTFHAPQWSPGFYLVHLWKNP